MGDICTKKSCMHMYVLVCMYISQSLSVCVLCYSVCVCVYACASVHTHVCTFH